MAVSLLSCRYVAYRLFDEVDELRWFVTDLSQFNVTEVPTDGNCMFSSIAVPLKKSSDVVRQEIVNFMRTKSHQVSHMPDCVIL
jgi:hypothetical protein